MKDLHPNLTSETPPSHYLDLMSKPTREGGIWGDYFIAVYVTLLLQTPIVCYNMNLISTTENLRPNWDSLDSFPQHAAPFYIVWANDHFYPMVPVTDPHSNDIHAEDSNENEGESDLHFCVHMNSIDLDKANFLMLTGDLSEFIGAIACPANRLIPVNDVDRFKEWLHVISDPVVVKVDAGNTTDSRNHFKERVVSALREFHGLVLSPNEDSRILSTNQVNIPVEAMATVLHDLGTRECSGSEVEDSNV